MNNTAESNSILCLRTWASKLAEVRFVPLSSSYLVIVISALARQHGDNTRFETMASMVKRRREAQGSDASLQRSRRSSQQRLRFWRETISMWQLCGMQQMDYAISVLPGSLPV